MMEKITYKRILSAVLAFCLFVTNFSMVTFASDDFAISLDGEYVSRVNVSENGKVTVSADHIPEDCTYQWQIKIPDTDQWIDIHGQTEQTLNLSYALLGSLLDEDSRAYVRCGALRDGVAEEYTDPLRVRITEAEELSAEVLAEPVAPDPLPAPTVAIEEEYYIPETYPEEEEYEEYEEPEETEAPTEEVTEPSQEETVEATEEVTEPAQEEVTEATEETTEAVEEETIEAVEEETTEAIEETVETTETETVPETQAEPETEPTSPAETEAEEEPAAPAEEKTLPPETEAPQPVLKAAPRSSVRSAEDTIIYTITIEYVYAASSQFAGQRVALPYIAQIARGDSPPADTDIPSPTCVGYSADRESVNLKNHFSAELTNGIQSNLSLTVEYAPAEVSYTVRHYQQNVDDDDYTWVDTNVRNAKTESLTNAEGNHPENTYEGFKHLPHYPEQVAADSSTMIDIYYDREYYLMDFELGGGYGVAPIYARYGTPISVGNPTKPGYVFDGWDATIPSTMPAEGKIFTANWEKDPDGVSYSIAYWIQEDDGTLTNIKTNTYTAEPGDPVVGIDDVCGTEVHTHDDTCGVCSLEEHPHTTACISTNIPINALVSLGSEDMKVMQDANSHGFDSSEIYIYWINTSTNSAYWPKIYINGEYYRISSSAVAEQTLKTWVSGTYDASGEFYDAAYNRTFYAYRYKINPSLITCGKTAHIHSDDCRTCGKVNHTHNMTCSKDEKLYRHLEYVGSDDPTTVSGDGTTVMNVYYRYKIYTIRYVYARKKHDDGSIQIANNTHQGGFDDCDWSTIGTDETILPKVNDPSGQTTETYRPQFKHTGEDGECTYYYISLTAKFNENIEENWPAANVGNIVYGSTWQFGSWASAPGTPYRDKSTLNANVIGSYPIMSDEMISTDSAKLEGITTPDGRDVYLAQNMIAWWNNGGVIGNHAYHNYFEILSGDLSEDQKNSVKETPTEIDGNTYILRGDRIYKLSTETFVAAHNENTRVDPLEFTGFTCQNKDHPDLASSQKWYNKNPGTEKYCILCKDNTDCNYCNTFYFNRNQHKLIFMNRGNYLMEGEGVDLKFGAPLEKYEFGVEGQPGASTIIQRPEKYPDDLEDGVYEFKYWCTTSDCHPESEIDWENATMPDANLILYAKWEKISHDVEIHITKPANADVPPWRSVEAIHDEVVLEKDRPNEADLKAQYESQYGTFLGWFYVDAQGKEQQFDFENSQVTQDIKVYAKWQSSEMKKVEIHYSLLDAGGDVIGEVAATESLMLRVGQTRTFEAKIGSSLYLEYQTGCFPLFASHSITPTKDDTEPLIYTFEYKKFGKVPYQVKFTVKEADGTTRPAFTTEDGKAKFIDSKTYTGYSEAQKAELEANPYIEQHLLNDKAVVTELHIPDNLYTPTWKLPDEYLPNALKVQHIIVPDKDNPETTITDKNTIEFIYTYTEPESGGTGSGTTPPVYKAKYLVQHFIEDLNGNTFTLNSFAEHEGLSGQTATASPVSIPGYSYSSYETTQKMEAYNNSRVWNEGDTKTDNALNEGSMTGLITANDNLELNFYYTRISYPYQVLYLEEGTNVVLKDAKKGTAKYGAKVTETAPDIEGYDVVPNGCIEVDGELTKSHYIQMEAGETANVNTITFLYKEKSANLIITKTVAEDIYQSEEENLSDENKQMLQNQEFAFTVHATSGFLYSVYDYSILDSVGNVVKKDLITTNGTYELNPIKIKGGQKIIVHELPMGEYTVEEDYAVGFRTTVSSEITNSATVTLEKANEDKTVNFVNTFPFYTGDLVIKKQVKDGETDVNTTKSYRVKITLNPAEEAVQVDRVITFVNAAGNPYMVGGEARTLTISAGKTDPVEFTVDVPVGDEVKLKGVPAGTFTAEEIPTSGIGSITDYYSVQHWLAVHRNDEVFENGHVVENGAIHGGHPTAVTFRNILKRGSLTINKTVTQEYAGDSWTQDTFTFSITGTTELPDGTYYAKIGSDSKAVTVSNGKLSLDHPISIQKSEGADEWKASVTIDSLPAGYYTVTEIAALGNDKYTMTVPDNALLVTEAENPTEFNFTNTFKRTTGNLKVSKVITPVEGATIDHNQDFTFTVKPPTDVTLSGSYACQIKTTDGNSDVPDSDTSLTATDNVLTFQLKHGQYIVIEGLPVGNYTVAEAPIDGYKSSFTDADPINGASIEPVTINTNATTELTCKNIFPVYFADLTVKKVVENSPGNGTNDTAPTDDIFNFTVTISNYGPNVDLSKGITAVYTYSDNNEETKIINLTDDKLQFKLKAGDSVNLNLPACSYTIAETGMVSTVHSGDTLADHYTTSYTVDGTVGTDGGTYQLASGFEQTVIFTNTYKQHMATLTIRQSGMRSESGIYQVWNSSDNLIATVMINGTSSVTLEQIPLGHYTVKEITNNWTWTHDPERSGEPVEVKAEQDNTVTFGQREETVDWLHSETWKNP